MSGIHHFDRRRRYREAVNNDTSQRHYTQDTPNYRFYCQLAHGSPTGIIDGFSTIRQLYQKIADCFDLPVSDILYCTLNTHKLDMDKVLGHELGVDDFLFAHIKSQPKEITILKESHAFGMTLTDSGCGVVFIKRLYPGGMMHRISEQCGGMIEIGDQIERINKISFVGRRHYDVAAYLQSIPVGETFLLRLVSPEKSPIYALTSRSWNKGSGFTRMQGKRTIRLKGNCLPEERTIYNDEITSVQRINYLLGTYVGFEDLEFASLLYHQANRYSSAAELSRALDQQFLQFQFPRPLIDHIWNEVNRRQPPPDHLLSNYQPTIRLNRRS